MWISGPITTVRNEHICHELAAVARVGLATRRWLSETSRSAAVVLGNHPISVSRISGKGAWMGAERDACAKTRVLAKVYEVGMKT
jgi:hypothetical protein